MGTGCQDPPVFDRAIAHAKNLFDFAFNIGYHFYLLDLGGGYPGNKGTSIDKIADVINNALDEHFQCRFYFIITEIIWVLIKFIAAGLNVQRTTVV